ncbi:MAG: methyl-accepting chemotaxis protein [Planctomycetes bacterium]|nr:methyl-accepting chemotaxis protein [Planctomycetota bacterium]
MATTSSLRLQLAGLAALTVSGLLVFAATAWLLVQRVQVTGPIYQDIIDDKDLLADILPPPAYIIESHLTVRLLLEAPDAPARAPLLAKLTELERQYDERLEVWRKLLEAGPVREALLDASEPPARQYYQALRQELLPLLARGAVPEATTLVHGRLDPLYARHREAIDQLVERMNGHFATGEATAIAAIRRSQWILVAIAALALAITVAAFWRFARRLAHGLGASAGVLEAMAGGDGGRRLPEDGPAELARLARAVNRTVDGMAGVIGGVTGRTTGLAAHTAQLDQACSALARSSDTTLQQVQAVAAASEQVSAQSATVAAAATEMEQSIRGITDTLAEHSARTREAGERADQAKATVLELERAAHDIGGMVATIRQISGRTNLLALNAAIEAASAGEAGRGFAVVAGEVKALAQQAAEASNDINTRVDTIGTDMQAATRDIARVWELVQRLHQDGDGVAAAMHEQLAATASISRTIAQAAQAVHDIAQAMTTVQQAAQATASATREVRVAADGVGGEADGLRRLVPAAA